MHTRSEGSKRPPKSASLPDQMELSVKEAHNAE